MIRRIKKGELITAQYLNQLGDSINSLVGPINEPKQINKPVAPEVQNEDTETVAPSDYVEQERTVETVDISGVEIDRIVTVSLKNANGEFLKFVFDNPEV